MNVDAIDTLYVECIFIVVVGTIFALLLLFRARRRDWAKKAVAITGIVDDLDRYLHFVPHDFTYRYRAIIRFHVSHETYTVKSKLGFRKEETVWQAYPQGSKVKVLYAPTNPQDARINSPEELYGGYRTNIISCLILSIIILLILNYYLISSLSGHH
jgi:hypothetical protein